MYKKINDIIFSEYFQLEKDSFSGHHDIILSEEFHNLAVDWIKEEIKIWEESHTLSEKGKVADVPEIKRWIERLGIKEGDLKCKKQLEE